MKINMRVIPTAKLENFADEHGLQLTVRERGKRRIRGAEPYYASFENTEVLDGAFLSGAHGNGNTPEEAIADYCAQISEETLVVDAFKSSRHEIKVPRLIVN